MSVVRRPSAWVFALAALALAGCSGSGADDDAEAISVFDIEPGMCFLAPSEILAELPDLDRVPCDVEHAQESYAVVDYRSPDGEDATAYPGAPALERFAEGACAEAFTEYVGVSYLDSALQYTQIFPSARGWEQGGDRTVVCFIYSTGAPLTASVAGSRL